MIKGSTTWSNALTNRLRGNFGLTDEEGGLLQQIVRRESTGRSRVCRALTTVARQLVTVTGEGLERGDLPDPVKGMLDRLA